MHRLVWAFAGRTYHIVGNLFTRLICLNWMINGLGRDKTCLCDFGQSETQTSLFSYKYQLEKWNFTYSFIYDTFQKANNKVADQTARMRRLVCVFVVRKPRRQIFSCRGPNIYWHFHYVCLIYFSGLAHRTMAQGTTVRTVNILCLPMGSFLIQIPKTPILNFQAVAPSTLMPT